MLNFKALALVTVIGWVALVTGQIAQVVLDEAPQEEVTR